MNYSPVKKSIVTFILCLLLAVIFLPEPTIVKAASQEKFTICYEGKNSNNPNTTILTVQPVGKAFTLKKNNFKKSKASFKGWYLWKEKDEKTLYYSYNSKGELGWRTLPNVVAYYVFYDQDEVSASRCKKLTSGETLYFRGIYTKKSINDSVSSKWKGYEYYTSITSKSSLNYHISRGKTYIKSDGTKVKFNTKTDTVTGIRYVSKNNKRYYCVAIGTYYGSVGSTHLVIMDNHVAFNVIITDSKSTKDAAAKIVNGKRYSLYHNKTDAFPVKHL